MRTAGPLVVALFLLLGCSTMTPVAIRSGDICEGCRRPIIETKIAAEILPQSGMPLKFRTVSCMAKYMARHQDAGAAVYVTDFSNGRFIRAQSAIFVKNEIDENTKEMDYYAFGRLDSALAFTKARGGSPTDWPSIRTRLSAGGAD